MLTKREIRMIATEIIKILHDERLCEDTFLTVKEAAEFIGFSTSYIYHNLDKIPHIRKDNNIRFSKRVLTDFIKQ